MARYYLDVIDGNGCTKDHEGVEFPSYDALRLAVSRVLLDVARAELSEECRACIRVAVRDDTDYVVFSAVLDYTTQCH